MDEFAIFGLSGGEALVLHIEQGHVFRFKIGRFPNGPKAVASRHERGQNATDEPELHLHAAAAFAERGLAVLREAEAPSWPEYGVSLWRKVMSRRPVKPRAPSRPPEAPPTPADTLHG